MEVEQVPAGGSERGTAFAQHVITLRSHLRRLVALAMAQPGTWDDSGLRRHVGRLDANVEALWRMTQMCIAEAEETGVPSPMGSAVKLRYSELGQEISGLALRLTGRAALDGESEVVREYLWSFQSTIAAGTSQIQRNLIAERILGMPKGR